MNSMEAHSKANPLACLPRALLQGAEAIERLVTVDVGGRGVVGGLYEAARAQVGHPLVLEAALGLRKSLKGKGTAFIATGWPDRLDVDGSVAESDGPPGAAVLARAFHRAFGVVPFILTEAPLLPGGGRQPRSRPRRPAGGPGAPEEGDGDRDGEVH